MESTTPAEQTVFPDEISEDIFRRLDAAADLVRVSAACSSFSRIVFARQFLRRFQSLHSPPILGFFSYRCREFLPVAPPHRSAPQSHALMQAADFAFSFLPDPHAWRSRHARDGRVLLSRCISNATATRFDDFRVCDPLHRRYVNIPRIPDDLLLAAYTPDAWRLSPVLAPADENDEQDESFRVICTVHQRGEGKFMALVFSSCNQTWRGIISTICLPGKRNFHPMPSYAHGCLYWTSRMGYSPLRLDASEMKFSIIDLPPNNFYPASAIVEAADGRLGLLGIGGQSTVDLYCKNWQSNGVGAQGWLLNKLIPLPKDSGIEYCWSIVGTEGRYVALVAHHVIYDESPEISELFVLDLKTLLIEKLCTLNNDTFYGFPYARFPPPLALPSI